MFTGIIEEIGEVISIQKLADGFRMTISGNTVMDDLKIDDSICIDGACQTIVTLGDSNFTVEAVGETIEKTTLGNFRSGRKVNLERSVTLQTRLGGHLVQGHVNGTGRITQWHPRGENYYLEIELSSDLLKYCVREGSIAIDGISLTIAKLLPNGAGISIIPHTVKHTTLHDRKTGDRVNIETDIISRYVERLMQNPQAGAITIDKLKQWGY